jgi:tripartite-type tricarboxylate transporter receptor subunit TctC
MVLAAADRIVEVGFSRGWSALRYGVWAPAGTPTAVVQTLSTHIARVLSDPDMRQGLAARGAEAMKMS